MTPISKKKNIPRLDRKQGLYLENTPDKGRGLFCISAIAEGEELEVTPALILNEKDTDKNEKTILNNYVFTTGKISKNLRENSKIKNLDRTSCVVMGIGSYCNHSKTPNAEIVWEQRKNTLYYILQATRKIPKNTEICTSYGDEWFDERK